MKKTLFFLSLLFVLVILTPSQAHAASDNFFAKAKDNVSTFFQKAYLSLPGEKSGQSVLGLSTSAMEGVSITTLDTLIDAKITTSESQDMGLKIEVVGPMYLGESYDPSNDKQDLKINGEVYMEGTSFKVDAEVKVDGKTSYVKLNQVPAIPYLPLSDIKGQWLKMENVASNDEGLNKEEEAAVNKALEKLIKDSQVSSAKREDYQGEKVWNIDISISDESVLQFVREYQEITKEEDVEQSAEELKKVLDATSDIMLNVKVGAKDYLVRSTSLNLEIDAEKINEQGEENVTETSNPFGQPKSILITFQIDFSDYGAAHEFSVPTDAKSFEEVMQANVDKMMQGAIEGSVNTLDANPPAINNTLKSEDYDLFLQDLPELSEEEEELIKMYGR